MDTSHQREISLRIGQSPRCWNKAHFLYLTLLRLQPHPISLSRSFSCSLSLSLYPPLPSLSPSNLSLYPALPLPLSLSNRSLYPPLPSLSLSLSPSLSFSLS